MLELGYLEAKSLLMLVKYISMGKKRIDRTRLLAECFKKDIEIFVEPGLSWVTGDRFAIAPTSFNYDQSEDRIITTYNNETGRIEFEPKLEYHHFG